MLAQQQQLNLTAHARCFTTSVKVNGRRFIAMVDFGATGNFMIRALVKKEGYPTQKKPDVYNLVIVDENSLLNKNERVNKETKSLSIAIQQHHEKLIFDIVGMVTHDIVLEMP
jgi:hypothetical protein